MRAELIWVMLRCGGPAQPGGSGCGVAFQAAPAMPFCAQTKKAHLAVSLLRYCVWCRHQESNPGPTDYKSVALPSELYRHVRALIIATRRP